MRTELTTGDSSVSLWVLTLSPLSLTSKLAHRSLFLLDLKPTGNRFKGGLGTGTPNPLISSRAEGTLPAAPQRPQDSDSVLDPFPRQWWYSREEGRAQSRGRRRWMDAIELLSPISCLLCSLFCEERKKQAQELTPPLDLSKGIEANL